MERQTPRLITSLRLPAWGARRGTSQFPLRLNEILWFALAIGLLCAHIARLLAAGVFGWPALLVVALALPLADFVSGLIHWTFDTWGNEQTPWVGSRLIRPFRVHHTHPRDLLGSHFFTTNSDAALANIPFLILAFCVPIGTEFGQLASLFLAALGGWGLPTSQIHKWAHTPRPPRWVGWMQRRGLILGPVHHDVHHAPPHTTNYCITTGWCNPFLARIGFFPRLERLISALTSWRPRAEESAEPAGMAAPFSGDEPSCAEGESHHRRDR